MKKDQKQNSESEKLAGVVNKSLKITAYVQLVFMILFLVGFFSIFIL
jgi:hypothetical protein